MPATSCHPVQVRPSPHVALRHHGKHCDAAGATLNAKSKMGYPYKETGESPPNLRSQALLQYGVWGPYTGEEG